MYCRSIRSETQTILSLDCTWLRREAPKMKIVDPLISSYISVRIWISTELRTREEKGYKNHQTPEGFYKG
jgi:hypothetical protein